MAAVRACEKKEVISTLNPNREIPNSHKYKNIHPGEEY